jgi:hypothetical protein
MDKSVFSKMFEMSRHVDHLWSSGQSSWLQIQKFGFDSRRSVWKEEPLSLANTIEELHERKISGYGLENLDYGRRDPLC